MVIKTILPTEEENIKILIIQIIKQRYKLHRMHNYIYFSRNFCYLHEFEHFDIQKISATRTFFSLIKKKKKITWGPQSKRYDASQLLAIEEYNYVHEKLLRIYNIIQSNNYYLK